MSHTIFVDPGAPKSWISNKHAKCVAISSLVGLFVGIGLIVGSMFILDTNTGLSWLSFTMILLGTILLVIPIVFCMEGTCGRGLCPDKCHSILEEAIPNRQSVQKSVQLSVYQELI